VREKSKLYILRELAALAACDHPNVVKLYDCVFEDSAVHLFCEHVTGYELFDWLSRDGRDGKVSEEEARPIVVQCLNALRHLHSRGVAHRDWKLDNVMVVPPLSAGNPDPFPLVKLIDFNLSGFFNSASETRESVGCIHYSSPWICGSAIGAERFAGQRHSPVNGHTVPHLVGMDGYTVQASDVWALAVGVFGMLQGYFPFRGTTIQALEAEVRAICRPSRLLGARLSYPVPISNSGKHFIELGMDPARPALASDLLEHPWMAPIDHLASIYPILRRERFDRVLPKVSVTPQAADDAWYCIGLLVQAARTAGRPSESIERMQLQALRRTAEALAGMASEAMTAMTAPNSAQVDIYPSPQLSFSVASDDKVSGFGAPVFRAASMDSGYGSAEFDAGIMMRV
jgi:serine/threonine protein kinase